MVHSWLVERMAEEHRRDLTILGSAPHRTTSRDQLTAQHADPALRLSPPADRRPVGHQVGTLLIRLGTRLGGASMRTS
jgi:hypothetical protein